MQRSKRVVKQDSQLTLGVMLREFQIDVSDEGVVSSTWPLFLLFPPASPPRIQRLRNVIAIVCLAGQVGTRSPAVQAVLKSKFDENSEYMRVEFHTLQMCKLFSTLSF